MLKVIQCITGMFDYLIFGVIEFSWVGPEGRN